MVVTATLVALCWWISSTSPCACERGIAEEGDASILIPSSSHPIERMSEWSNDLCVTVSNTRFFTHQSHDQARTFKHRQENHDRHDPSRWGWSRGPPRKSPPLAAPLTLSLTVQL